ncbi:DinB family protein [Deinococcus navajonensis]|uniref:DinB family protein n=1 Tax=Deinococcus navajonensis TaxID=309884 RepID=A0ABV8XNA9_9DEIO
MTEPLQDPAVLMAFGQTPAEVRERLSNELDRFEAQLRTRQADWTRVQPERDWSPAQEAEHVLLINEGITRLLALLLSSRELRAAPQTPGVMKEGRRQAPPHTLPSAQGLAWAEMDGRWAEHRTRLEEAASQVRATPGRTMWHPFYGELDALDWLRMIVGHLYSHRRLLERSAGA